MGNIVENVIGGATSAMESISKPFVQILTNPEKALKNTLKSTKDFVSNPVKSIEDTLNHWGKTLKNDPNIAKIAAVVVNAVPGIGQATSAAITASIVAANSRANGQSFDKAFINAGLAAALSVGASELKDMMKGAGVTEAEFAAADAKQLASQGLSKDAISKTLSESYDLGSINPDNLAEAALNKNANTLDKIQSLYNKVTGSGSNVNFSNTQSYYADTVTTPLDNLEHLTTPTTSAISFPVTDSNIIQGSLPAYTGTGESMAGIFNTPNVDLSALDSLATGINSSGAQVGTNIVKQVADDSINLDQMLKDGATVGAGAGTMYGAGSGANLANVVSAGTNPLTVEGAALTGAGSAGLNSVLNNPLVTATAAAGGGALASGVGGSLLNSLTSGSTLKDIAGLWNSYNTGQQQQQIAQDVLKYSNPYYNYQQQYEIPLKIAEGQYAQEQQALAGDTLQKALASANNASMQDQFNSQLATAQGFNTDFDKQQAIGTGLEGQYNTQLGNTQALAAQLAAERQQVNPMVTQFNQAATDQLTQNDLYNQQLALSYNDPLAIYNTPEMKALSDVFMGSLERKDAAAGRNSQYGARAVEAQNNFLNNLNTYRGTLNNVFGTGQSAATGYGNTAVGYQNADTNKINAGNSLLGNYNTTLGNITNQYNANTANMNAITGAQNANNAILGNITGQQNANTAITNSLNSIYGNQNTAINNALDFASATGNKADTGGYANAATGAVKSDAATVAAGANILGNVIGPQLTDIFKGNTTTTAATNSLSLPDWLTVSG